MIPYETVALFLTAAFALCLAPGPDNIFVLTQSALYGRLAGIAVTLGLCTGLLVHSAAVALGVAAIFQTSELAFSTLKLLGATYLVYLAVQAFRAGRQDLSGQPMSALSAGALYRRGIVMNITNPKIAVFFLAFLPQFADPERGSVSTQIIVFGALFIVCTILVFGAVALGGSILGAWLKRSERVQLWTNKLAGTVFLVLAVRLAVSER